MSDQKRFQIYFAGASLAFGLPFLIIEIMGLIIGDEFLSEYSVIIGFFYISIHAFGGLLGGALVARNVQREEMIRSAAISGLMAYLLHQIVYYLFFGASVIGDPYTLFALIGGSIAGSIFTRQNSPKNNIEKQEEGLPS
jgi:hypothetical protein